MSNVYNVQDKANVASLLKILAGLGVLSAGAGMTVGGIKAFRKRMLEAAMPSVAQPSKALHNSLDSNRINISSDYFPDPEEIKTASALVQNYQEMVKEAGMVGDFFSRLFKPVTDAAEKVTNAIASAPQAAVDTANKFKDDLKDWFTGATTHDVTIGSGYERYNPSAPFMDRVESRLAQYPGFNPLWFLPSAVAVAGLGYTGGKKVVDIIDKLLGKANQRSFYNEKARKIYNESAKYLQDVASGKIKLKDDEEEPSQVKESAFTKQSEEVYAGNGQSSFWFNPNFILGLLGAGWVMKQLKGMARGSEEAQQELADRTHALWAAMAAQKERNYDYNGLQIDLEEEPTVTSKDKKLRNQATKLRNSVKDDNNYFQTSYENNEMSKIRKKQFK